MDRSITFAVDVEADPSRVVEILSTAHGERAFWTAGCAQTWALILDRLQRYVATGSPQQFPATNGWVGP